MGPFLLLALALQQDPAPQVSAEVDRERVGVGDVITLIIRAVVRPGSAVTVKLAIVPSTSLPLKVTGMPGASSTPLAFVMVAVGASFAPFTVTVIWRTVPSAVVTVKVSVGCWLLVSACTLASPLRSA